MKATLRKIDPTANLGNRVVHLPEYFWVIFYGENCQFNAKWLIIGIYFISSINFVTEWISPK